MRDHVALWVAIAAAAPGVIALILCGLMWRTLRQVRHDQQVLLPEGARAGLVDRQASLQRGIERVEEEIRSLRDQSDARQRATDERLRGALRFQGLVRYDAYRDMGGQQSWSIALLDATRTGAVVTSLHARDHARVYLKEMAGGVSSQRLSPEEERAVALAMGDQAGGEAA
jgi:uncharacterized protein DUF4446